MSEPQTDLERSWAELVSWLEKNAPVTAATLQGPADPERIEAAQFRTGLRWPDDLVAWLGLSDGAGRSSAGRVLPFYVPLGVEDIVETWEMLNTVGESVFDAADRAADTAAPAGTTGRGGFLRVWIPIAADYGGDFYFVDLRRGPRRGCVGQYDEVDAFHQDPFWEGVTAMISDVLDAVRAGRQILHWQPQVEDGRLSWHVPPPPPRPPEPLHDLRAQLLLLHRWSDQKLAARFGITAELVRKWRQRFIEDCPYDAWEEVVARHAVGSPVTGVVFSHHPFGVYVDLGLPFPAALAAEYIPGGQYPPVGSVIEAVVARHDRSIGQLEIDARPLPS